MHPHMAVEPPMNWLVGHYIHVLHGTEIKASLPTFALFSGILEASCGAFHP